MTGEIINGWELYIISVGLGTYLSLPCLFSCSVWRERVRSICVKSILGSSLCIASELQGWAHFVYTSIISFYMYHFIEWILHKLAHNRKWGGEIYRIHIKHHNKYCRGSLIQDGPYVGADGEKAFGLWVFLIWVVVYIIFDIRISAVFIIESFILMIVSNHLHEEFHVKNSWLEQNRFTRNWFLHRREQHFLHHYKPSVNLSLGGINSIADYEFGTHMDVMDGVLANEKLY